LKLSNQYEFKKRFTPEEMDGQPKDEFGEIDFGERNEDEEGEWDEYDD
jgi:hypothetical protein